MRAMAAFLLSLALAGAASAATVSVVVEEPPDPFSGDIVTITTTLVTDGTEAPAAAVSLQLLWDGSLTVSQGPVQYFGSVTSTFAPGLVFPWSQGTGNCPPAPGSCLLLDMLAPGAPTPRVPDAGVFVSVLELVRSNIPGEANYQFGVTNVFGATPTLEIVIIPEPATGALLALGLVLLGRGRAGRR